MPRPGRFWWRRTEATFFGNRAAKPGEGGKGGAGDGVSRNAAFTTFSAFPAPAAEKSRTAAPGTHVGPAAAIGRTPRQALSTQTSPSRQSGYRAASDCNRTVGDSCLPTSPSTIRPFAQSDKKRQQSIKLPTQLRPNNAVGRFSRF